MDRIKGILNKKIYIREIIMLVFIVLSLLYLSIYTSFAIFEKTVEKVGVVVFEASKIMLSLSADEPRFSISNDGSYGTITVEAGTTKSFDLTIKNETPIDVKYKTWYRFVSEDIPSDVGVGISSKSENPNTSTLSKKGNNGDNKIVRIVITNNSTEVVSIDIGVQGGYANNEVVLNNHRSEMSTIQETSDAPTFEDTSGANPPILAEGMIPVVYDETKEVWVRADTDAGWYAYQDQIWANAVTTTSENRATYLSDSHIGKEIPMDEINSMWVWIPRFKYNINSTYGTHADGTPGTKPLPGLINVEFETEKNSTGSVYSEYINSTTTKYYTHPAFRNGSTVYNEIPYDIGGWDEELPGFWVGKFETSGTEASPLIKPNVVSKGFSFTTFMDAFENSLVFTGGTKDYPDISTSFTNTTFETNPDNEYGLNTTNNKSNSHMTKSSEWAAVAYLSQSIYGKMGNDDYTGANKEIYLHVDNTGFSSGMPSTSGATSCSYDDIENRGNGTGACGAGASTTGNIYGIYDMNGGRKEFVMATDTDLQLLSSCYHIPSSDLRQNDNVKKYHDFLGSYNIEDYIPGNISIYEANEWYNDNYPNSRNCSVKTHGGNDSGNAINSGIFATVWYDVNSDTSSVIGYRTTLMANLTNN